LSTESGTRGLEDVEMDLMKEEQALHSYLKDELTRLGRYAKLEMATAFAHQRLRVTDKATVDLQRHLYRNSNAP
jgi:hypothetical protein